MAWDDNDDFVEVAGEVIRTTEKAVLVRTVGDDEVWVPRSMVEGGGAVQEGDEDIQVKEWFALKEGLV